MIAAADREPTLSRSLITLLAALTRGGCVDHYLRFERSAGSCTVGADHLDLAARLVDPEWVPLPVVRLLEESGSPWFCALALRAGTFGPLTSISALAVSFRYEREFVNPEDRDVLVGQRWVWPQSQMDAAAARANQLLPPTITVDAGGQITFVWALDEPFNVEEADGQATALNILRRLAAAIGAAAPVDDLSLAMVPLPGTTIFNATALGEVTTVTEMAPARVYSIDTISAAIAAYVQE